MAKFYVVRKNNVFYPASESDAEIARKFPYGKVLSCKIWKERNVNFHRKFFALLKYVFNNQDRYKNIKHMRVAIELECGNYDEYVTLDGKLVYVTKSISFESMDEVEFEELYNNAIDVILDKFIRGDTRENINNQVNEILCFL